MISFIDTFATRVGPFSLAVNDDGAVVATAFGDADRLRTRAELGHVVVDGTRTRSARESVQSYFAGELTAFDLPIAPRGTPFQLAVWKALSRIPYGETRSYGGLAVQLGRPGAARAIGRANGANPICLIVPCHRVLGADGSLTGFAFGETLKRALLEHERAGFMSLM
jgi:methylated-DNA-[protein]-cysteine S-methyltransferase